MVSEIVIVLHVSTVSFYCKIIPESFHMLNVSARWVSQNLRTHDRHWRVASSRAARFIHNDRTVLSFGYWGQNVDLSLGPVKQIRIHALEARGSPHIYTNL